MWAHEVVLSLDQMVEPDIVLVLDSVQVLRPVVVLVPEITQVVVEPELIQVLALVQLDFCWDPPGHLIFQTVILAHQG